MSASCRFCGAEFSNAQAVRAHLKGCAAYQNRPPREKADRDAPRQASLGSASLGDPSLGNDRNGAPGGSGQDFDPVRRVEQQIIAERRRLELREVEDAHREMDRRTEAAERARQQAEQQEAEARRNAERDRENARLRAENEKAEQARRQVEDTRRRSERRVIIQNDVCQPRPGGAYLSSPIFSAAMNASCGISTLPNWRIFFLPRFCASRSLRLRVASPP